MRYSLTAVATAAGLAVAYVAVPAVWRAQEAATVVGSMQVRGGLLALGIDPDAVEGGAYLSALKVQTVASVTSLVSGFAIDTRMGKAWHVSDAMLEAVRNPAVGRMAVFSTRCGESTQLTTFLVNQAQPGHTAREAVGQLADPSVFKPGLPGLLKENLDLQELHSTGEQPHVLYALGARPQPLWHIPRLGTFENVPDRRADIARQYPEMDALQCDASQPATVDAAQTMAALRAYQVEADALQSLLQWAKSPTSKADTLPSRVQLTLPGVGTQEFVVTVKDVAGQTQLELQAKPTPALPWDQIHAALVPTAFAGHLVWALDMHLDGTQRSYARELRLADSKLQLSGTLDKGQPALTLRWTTTAAPR